MCVNLTCVEDGCVDLPCVEDGCVDLTCVEDGRVVAEEGEGGQGAQRVIVRQLTVHDPNKPDSNDVTSQYYSLLKLLISKITYEFNKPHYKKIKVLNKF